MSLKKTAVALSYPENKDAPFIVAKEKGMLADKLLEIARENNVPIVENEFLSQVLSVQEIGDSIPVETWEIVAEIFAIFVENKN